MIQDMASCRAWPSPSRVLVVGLDMGDGGLIRYWSQQGRLPHFAALSASGTWLVLESTARVLHTSTWPTFATGVLPGRHGVYYPYQPKPGHQLAQHIGPDQYGAPTFWQVADAQGRRCLVYDIPETFPALGFRGRAIFEWGTWAWYGEPAAQPATLLKELKQCFGAYPLGLEAKRLGLRSPDATAVEQRLLRSIEYKGLTAQWLLEREGWDLAVLGFCEPHPAGHYLWPAGADGVDHADAALFQPLFNVYAAIDRTIGALYASMQEDTTLLVVSGDGVRPNRCGWHLLPMVLERLGYTCPHTGGSTAGHLNSKPSLLGRVQGLLPPTSKRWIIDRLPWRLRDRLGAQSQGAAIDWSRTRAFTLPTDLEGCIRINLKGREPQGIVEPGAQYTDLCEEIRTRLEELSNPANGAYAVREVWIRDEIFSGARQEHLPDLMVTWNDMLPFAALASPYIGLVERASPDPRTGTHSPEGFLLAAGPGIRRHHQGDGHLLDVAPTVLRLLGIEPPAEMHGRLLTAFTPGEASRHLSV
jgi:predicted AlkP superfamily phosphohydrolase/phosphomutase